MRDILLGVLAIEDPLTWKFLEQRDKEQARLQRGGHSLAASVTLVHQSPTLSTHWLIRSDCWLFPGVFLQVLCTECIGTWVPRALYELSLLPGSWADGSRGHALQRAMLSLCSRSCLFTRLLPRSLLSLSWPWTLAHTANDLLQPSNLYTLLPHSCLYPPGSRPVSTFCPASQERSQSPVIWSLENCLFLHGSGLSSVRVPAPRGEASGPEGSKVRGCLTLVGSTAHSRWGPCFSPSLGSPLLHRGTSVLQSPSAIWTVLWRTLILIVCPFKAPLKWGRLFVCYHTPPVHSLCI